MAEKLTYEKVLKMFAETDKKLKTMFAETDRQFKETDKRLRRTEALIAQNAKEIGGIGKSNGRMAEEIFINSLSKKPKISGVTFKEVKNNFQINTGMPLKTLDEIDLLLSAKDRTALIEIKYKVSNEDVWALIHKKLTHFLTAYPEYKKKEVYLGIAGCAFDKDVADAAQKMGIAVFKLSADAFVEQTKYIKSFTKEANLTEKITSKTKKHKET